MQHYPRLFLEHLHGLKLGTQAALPSDMSKRRTRKNTTDRSTTTDVVTQLECAARNPHAAAIGALLGGLVPWFGRTLAHEQVPSAWAAGSHWLAVAMIAVVLGCGVFSGLSVYKFGKAAFGDARKALGFVLALEGVMLVSHGVTSAVALAVLILINAVSNGSVIALARNATRRRCEADERRAATRAAARTHNRIVPPLRPPVVSKAKVKSQALVAPVWRRATLDDVIDAEIIS